MPLGPNVLAIDDAPKKLAIVVLNTLNTFASGGAGGSYYLITAWIPTNTPNKAKWSASFASLQTSTSQPNVIGISTRQSFLPGKTGGFVVDVLLKSPLMPGQVVSLCVGQTGATDYSEPEKIQD